MILTADNQMLAFRPQHYMDIGHDNPPYTLWWWDKGKLEILEADSKNTIHEDFIDTENTWNGRYDPLHESISIHHYTKKRVPPDLRRSLEAEFPNAAVWRFEQNQSPPQRISNNDPHCRQSCYC